jgi:hypothetical protein
MDRRTFLLASAGLAAGCSRGPGPAAGLSPDDAETIASQRERREQHLRELARFRVSPDAKRTTAPPPADVLAVAPELKGLTRVAVRLHPRFSDEPAADESKLGGQFLWPAAEPWPTCDEHRIPFVPVLQLRAEDAPPQWPYRPGTDLVQLVWCPRDHGEGWVKPRLVWRKRPSVVGPVVDHPPTDAAFMDYVPVPCRLFPERVTEYERLLSAAPGTKVGGYPRWVQGDESPACPSCRWGMDHLLTAASDEWDGASWARWMPLEERPVRDGRAISEVGYYRAAGLKFADLGSVYLFVCRRCDGWPVRAVGQTS